jgi:hypothetical protein
MGFNAPERSFGSMGRCKGAATFEKDITAEIETPSLFPDYIFRESLIPSRASLYAANDTFYNDGWFRRK